MDLEKTFLEIIERKHRELNLGQDYMYKFSKVKDFEGNAIGQIGEEYFKAIVSRITQIIDDGVIHNEYDILTVSGIYFEVKTARKGRSNNTFQFNGINPSYNYHYLICLGVCEEKLLYRIFKKNEIEYKHRDRKHYIVQGDFQRQLVQMNPNNLVNLKLTLNITDLFDIQNLIRDLQEMLN
jgi:hypothetical protein